MHSSQFFVVFLTFCSIWSVSALQRCTIKRFGKLTMFNGELVSVELPCKYRLADFTCKGYRAVVTVSGVVDGSKQNRFTPSFPYVKISGRSEFYAARTSEFLLKQAMASSANDPWTGKTGDLALDFDGYNASAHAAQLTKGPLTIQFREKGSSGDDAGVVVTCDDDDFSSQGLDSALCGDSTTGFALQKWKAEEFGCGTLVTYAQALHYIILGDDRIAQSSQCTAIAAKFQGCAFKENAATWCEAILGNVKLAGCLARSTSTELHEFYLGCLQYTCDGVEAATTLLRNHVALECSEYLDLIPLDVCLI